MENTTNIPTSLYIPSQFPLDRKGWIINEISLSLLGVSDNLAYTYYTGLIVYCAEEDSYWKWRPKSGEEIGLITEDFTYPDPWIKDGVDYSNTTYNFFPYTASINQNNYVRNLLIPRSELPETYGKSQVIDYILGLDPSLRTIAETDSKWNFLVVEEAEGGYNIFSVYELQNTGKGIITDIDQNNLLSFQGGIQSFQDVLNVDATLANDNNITILQTFRLLSGIGGNVNGLIVFDEAYTSPTIPFVQIGKGMGNSTTDVSLNFFPTKVIFIDKLNQKGIEYEGNYSANFGPRSLITKEFAESLIGGNTDYYFEGSVTLQSGGSPRLATLNTVRSNLPNVPTITVTGNRFELVLSGVDIESNADVTGSVSIGHNLVNGTLQSCSGYFSITGVDTRAFKIPTGADITDDYTIFIIYKAKKAL